MPSRLPSEKLLLPGFPACKLFSCWYVPGSGPVLTLIGAVVARPILQVGCRFSPATSLTDIMYKGHRWTRGTLKCAAAHWDAL